jgi:hypothetical protein
MMTRAAVKRAVLCLGEGNGFFQTALSSLIVVVRREFFVSAGLERFRAGARSVGEQRSFGKYSGDLMWCSCF